MPCVVAGQVFPEECRLRDTQWMVDTCIQSDKQYNRILKLYIIFNQTPPSFPPSLETCVKITESSQIKQYALAYMYTNANTSNDGVFHSNSSRGGTNRCSPPSPAGGGGSNPGSYPPPQRR